MKDFLHVFSFYLNKQLRNKVFVFVTLFMCIASSVSMIVVPKLLSSDEKRDIYVVNQCSQLNDVFENDDFRQFCSESMNLDFSMLDSTKTSKEIEKTAKDKELDMIYFSGDSDIEMKIIGDVSVSDINTMHNILNQMFQMKSMEALGIDKDTLQKSIPNITITYADTEENDSKFLVIIILSLVIVSFIIMYSTSATNEVAYLKTNRVMEMLLTSTKGIPLYLGINLAYAVVPFIQVSLISLCVLLVKHFAYSNKASDISIDFSILTSEHIVAFIALLLLGYFVYSLINTALVSMVNKSEDIIGISVPISFIGIIQYFVGIMAVTENTMLIKVFSYIPFTSPTVMFIRYAVGFVSVYEVLAAIAILLVTIYLLLRWGANVFTKGITYYSFTGNIRQTIKKFKENR
ncbi:ABC transporter permease [[Clostridium] polysaccharolyticum]|uniref:ABC-2 type transport system permease protein n=1 Tax=[Clostridium] polysaccharolyticum TaxID=29364 RepID=A0A1I0E0L1_9FIRM|nr:ABC transporter permease [[Clostridium] polysaccharolyticum]SET37674.1 ABC-2 type transport system permease protein [[Clostridium] polysaccharolyticum]